MPELPDVEIYVERLRALLVGQTIHGIRLKSPFLVRSFRPRLSAAHGKALREVRRLGKRIIFGLDDDLFIVIHLMVAGRFRYGAVKAKIPGKLGLAAFDFDDATIILTEAGTKRRASLHLVEGEAAVAEHDRGGLEVMDLDLDAFRTRLTARNHTLKRALTDPRIFSGIGNAYSDEILWEAQLSPIKWTSRLDDTEIARLHAATIASLARWTERFRTESGDGFPKKVTAFRPDMATHGKYGAPCPRCDDPVQRIRYADNETNYCATCQTGGKLLADRSMSRLLKGDWPKTIAELEDAKEQRKT
ncbi:MAG: formamidopyrimidine-DNA glycosylase [Myxococcota bacterium]|jgi:formamidopyrimidine-DNA glycosylase